MTTLHGMDDFEFEGFGIVFVCHKAGDDTLEEVFVDTTGCYVVDYRLHTLHEAIGVPIIAVMHKELNTYGQCKPFVGVLEIMSGA